IALNLKHPEGLAAALRLVATADIVTENFRPGTMKKLGLDYETLKARHPRVIYVSHKGFLPGPYQNRTALDEVAQMMGGLAYMTGRIGDPLRAGSSVIDIMGGMFAAMGAMAALRQRETTGVGCEVQSALYESVVFLMAQHMLQFAATGRAADPMPSRISSWGVYDVFTVKEGEQIFLSAVSDKQWRVFCDAFGFDDLLADPRLATNNDRVLAREWMMAILRARLAGYSARELAEIFERHELPFAPITKPQDLFDDPHLRATGALADVRMNDGSMSKVPLPPFTMDGQRSGVQLQPPATGEHTRALLEELGYTAPQIDALLKTGVVVQEKIHVPRSK
ncbi:MAG: CaiB/BaiF CoA-transferase family protein, partial [Variovorax sp.]